MMSKTICTVLVALACFTATSEGSLPVKAALYYEALSPESKDFLGKSLGELTDDTCFDDTEWLFVPYGNAYFKRVDGKETVICEHGELECQRNLEQLCVLKHLHSAKIDGRAIAKAILCMESRTDKDLHPVDWCLKTIAPELTHDIHTCVSGSEGKTELVIADARTTALSPRFTVPWLASVPWLTMNGKHVDATQDIKDLLCEASNKKSIPCCAKQHKVLDDTAQAAQDAASLLNNLAKNSNEAAKEETSNQRNWFADAAHKVASFFSNLFEKSKNSLT